MIDCFALLVKFIIMASILNEVSAHLVGDLPRDLVCPDGVLGRGLLEAKIGPHKDEGRGDAKPEEEQRKEGAEGHCAAALLAPHQHVEGEEDGKEHPREQ